MTQQVSRTDEEGTERRTALATAGVAVAVRQRTRSAWISFAKRATCAVLRVSSEQPNCLPRMHLQILWTKGRTLR